MVLPDLTMSDLDRFRESVEQIESTKLRADADSCRRLQLEICNHAWRTVSERNAAQVIVNRLEALRHGEAP